MNGGKPAKDSDEKRFNETLKRMLKTPPTPHDAPQPNKSAVDKPDDSGKGAEKSKG